MQYLLRPENSELASQLCSCVCIHVDVYREFPTNVNTHTCVVIYSTRFVGIDYTLYMYNVDT